MEPGTYIAAGKIIGPKAASLIGTQVRKRGWAVRAVQHSFRRVPSPHPVIALARWVRLDSTIEAVWSSADTPGADVVAAADAHLAERSRRWRALEVEVRRTRLASVIAELYGDVISEQDASRAVRTASARSQNRYESTTKLITALSDSVDGRPVDAELAERIRQLPAHLRDNATARAKDSKSEVWRVVQQLTSVEASPVDTILQWQRSMPLWLSQSAVSTRLLAADIAWSYGGADLARDLYLAAAREGAPRASHWAARAAFISNDSDGAVDVARGIIDEFRGSPSDPMYDCVDALVAGNLLALRASVERWDPDDPLERGLRYRLYAREVLGREGANADKDGLDDAIAVGRRECESPASSTVTRLLVAQLLVDRVKRGLAANVYTDLRAATELAVRCRDERRACRGDSAGPVAVACVASLLAGDLSGVIRIGQIDATDVERSSSEVRVQVLLARAERGEDVAAELDSGVSLFSAAVIRATMGRRVGIDVLPFWQSALEASADDAQRFTALAGMARAGADQLPGLDEFTDRLPDQVREIRALQQVARGDRGEAIAQLRARATSSRNAAITLAEVFRDEGRIDDEVATLKAAADTFHDPAFRFDAALALARAQQIDRARREISALLVGAADWPGLRDARRLGVDLAMADGDVVQAQDLLRELLNTDPTDAVARWGLVHLLLGRSAFPEAWAVLRERSVAADPITERDAVAWLELHREYSSVEEAVRGCLRLARQFPESEVVRGAALRVSLLIEKGEDLVPEDVTDQLRADLVDFTTRWPESEMLRPVKVPDDPDELRALMDDWVRPTPEASALRRDVSVRLAVGDYPLGVLSSLVSLTYAEVVLRRGEDVLPARSLDPAETAASLAAARASKGQRVAVDVSSLAVTCLIGDATRAVALGWFSAETVDDVLRDARVARAALSAPHVATLVWDADAETSWFLERDAAVGAALAKRSDDLVRAIEMVRRVPSPTSSSDGSDIQAPWLRLFELARSERLPIWADDVVLRQMARAEGIPAFSTFAVLELLREAGVMTSAERSELDRIFLTERVGDLPLNTMQALMMESAEEDGWRPGAVAFAFQRPAQWIDPPATLALLRPLLVQIRAHAPSSIPTWSRAFFRGAALAHRGDLGTATSVISALFATIAYSSGVQGESAAGLVRACRAALIDVGYAAPNGSDPVVDAIGLMYRAMSKLLPHHVVAPYIFGFASSIEDERDRQAIVRLVLTDEEPVL